MERSTPIRTCCSIVPIIGCAAGNTDGYTSGIEFQLVRGTHELKSLRSSIAPKSRAVQQKFIPPRPKLRLEVSTCPAPKKRVAPHKRRSGLRDDGFGSNG